MRKGDGIVAVDIPDLTISNRAADSRIKMNRRGTPLFI